MNAKPTQHIKERHGRNSASKLKQNQKQKHHKAESVIIYEKPYQYTKNQDSLLYKKKAKCDVCGQVIRNTRFYHGEDGFDICRSCFKLERKVMKQYEYIQNENVLCLAMEDDQWYKAKVIGRKTKHKNAQYHIHYIGWGRMWDEWVLTDRLAKGSQNKGIFEQLLKKQSTYHTSRDMESIKLMKKNPVEKDTDTVDKDNDSEEDEEKETTIEKATPKNKKRKLSHLDENPRKKRKLHHNEATASDTLGNSNRRSVIDITHDGMNMDDWSVDQAVTFIQCKFPEICDMYYDKLVQNKIDGKTLKRMGHAEWEYIGISKMLTRINVLQCVKEATK